MLEKTSRARRSPGPRPVDPVVAKAMKAVVACQTDEGLSEQFGLSYNTWRKIRSGLPIRRSVAERVELRVRQLMAVDARKPRSGPANNNEPHAPALPRVAALDDQARFERVVARELAGELDF